MEFGTCLNAVPGLILVLVLLVWMWSALFGGAIGRHNWFWPLISTMVCGVMALVIAFGCALCLGFSEVYIKFVHFIVWLLCMAPVFTVFMWWPWLLRKINSRMRWPVIVVWRR